MSDEWNGQFCNDPLRDNKLYVEVSRGDAALARIFRGDDGKLYLKHPLDFRSEIDRLPLRVRSPASKLDDASLTSGPRTTGTIARKGHVGSVQSAKRRFLEMRGSLRSCTCLLTKHRM
jgi:hypothetical protein